MELSVAGASAYFYTGGKPWQSGQPCLTFIHGAQHDHSVWILQSRYFAHHGFNVLAPDLPGHGRSSGPPLASIEAQAGWMAGLLDAAGVQSTVLIGHSMGSLIALEFAAQARARVARVALLAPAYPMQVSAALLDAARDDEPRAIEMINIWSHSSRAGGFSQKPSNPGPGFCLVLGNQRLMERQSPGVLHVDFSACNAYRNEAALPGLGVPALVLLGERDAMTPARAGRALAARLPQHEVQTIAGAGHALMGEAPDAVLEALKPFVAAAWC